MAPKKSTTINLKTLHRKKMHDGKEVEPVKVFPGNKMCARYKGEDHSLVIDSQGNPIAYKSL